MMTTMRTTLAVLLLVGCGESAAETSAAAPVEAVQAPEAPAAPVAPAAAAAPATIGNYGPFLLSANSISVNGQCMEIAANLPADPTEAAAMQEAFRGMAERTARGAGADAVSTNRCPTEGRVAGVTGGCAMAMPAGAYVSYFYTTGEHPSSTEAAQAQCTQVQGVWTE